MNISIGILGTRGIPNHYGGFERLAEQLSRGLVDMGHDVFVYNSHNHVYQEKKWNGVNIVHCYDPEYKIGTSGQFIYDLNCILDARKRKFDVILMLGYTSSSIWNRLLPADTVIIYNMDGMEWKRTKYSKPVRSFLRYAERLAVDPKYFYITDSPVIQTYFKKKYKLDSDYIAYGAEQYCHENEAMLNEYGVSRDEYFMLVARLEPENNVEMILDGFHKSKTERQFLVVGNTANKFGRHLLSKFSSDKRILFTGAIYDAQKIHSLRVFSRLYFHGHSAGGTNPSLLEAMGSRAFVIAHDNLFNRAVLQNDAYYFSCADDITVFADTAPRTAVESVMIRNNLIKIQVDYNWQDIFRKYEGFMLRCLYANSHERNILHKRYAG